MKKTYSLLFLLALLIAPATRAQAPADRRAIRIVDTLTSQERKTRVPILLKAELDSIIQLQAASQPQPKPVEPVKEVITRIPNWITIAGLAALVIISLLLYLLFRYHRRLNRTVGDLKRLIQNFEQLSAPQATQGGDTDRSARKKSTAEKKLEQATAELEQMRKDYEVLAREYGLIKQSIADVYKVRNYPGFNKDKSEEDIIQHLLQTEKFVAYHAFEKYLKPVLAIADSNKNNPARISAEDSEKMLELLLSLALYYTEYLYLRVSDLSVGGHIVQRIGSNGKGIDPSLLKKLNTEHGSRALALRMALNKSGISQLSYPVFDETDLNHY